MTKDKGNKIEHKALHESEDTYWTLFETTGTATIIIEEAVSYTHLRAHET